MKRIGIFVFYDRDGIVDEADEHLIKSLPEITDRLIITINGKINGDSYTLLQKYTNEIICRPNYGYDAGAYREVILNYLHRDELNDYEELILLNNTFYGPFYSWKLLFSRMESKTADFWGLSKQRGFHSNYLNMDVEEYVNSFFLVFRKPALNNAFYAFWESMPELKSFSDVYKHYEIRLTRYLKDSGLSYCVYTDLYPQLAFLKENRNMYMAYSYFLIRDCQFPIIKRKAVVEILNEQAIPSLQYIKDRYHYDIEILQNNARRTVSDALSIDEIGEFREKHNKIMLYGTGSMSKLVENGFEAHGWPIDGYIETNPKTKELNGKPVIAWKDFNMDEQTGIIVAMDRPNAGEIKQLLPDIDSVLYLIKP